MALAIGYERRALAFLKRVPKKLRGQLAQRIERLRTVPHPPGSKKLKGVNQAGHPVYREVSGDYRILYMVVGDRLLVLDIDNRKDIYRRL